MNQMTDYRAECFVNANKGTGKHKEYVSIGKVEGSYIGDSDPMRMMFAQNPNMLPADKVIMTAWEHNSRY